MACLSFRESFLSVLIFVTAILGISTASPENSAYGQPSHTLMNFIPSADNPANQPEISKGGQQLIIIPSLSDGDIAVTEEQANEEGQQGQELDSKQTSIRENEEEKLKENLEKAIKYQEYNDNGDEEKNNFNNDNEIPLELPFP